MGKPEQPDIQWKRTHCSRMDHGGCTLKVGVKDNRIVRVKGDPDGLLNRGYVCAKGLASPERLNHQLRLRTPLKRTGERGEGEFEPISWDEALETICKNLDTARKVHGARSVAFCQGMPKGLEHFVLIRLANLFGSPNVVACQDVCHAPREIAGRHTCGFYPVSDFHHLSKLVVLWGSNITATNEEGEICRLLLDQVREHGARLIVIDPRRTALARSAELWLPVRPGTDTALALGFLNVIIGEALYDHDFVENRTHGFEDLANHVKAYTPEAVSAVTRVPAGRIRAAAREYARATPAAIQWGNPLEHTNNAFHAARALVCLMAVCGNLDRPGGNVQTNEPPILGLGKFVRADRIPGKPREMIHAHHGAIAGMMTVPPAYFKKAVLEHIPYPVKAAYVQCSNPMLTWADSASTFQALNKLDFLAVSDIVMTPTAAMADIVLPAATGFEFNDIGHYGLGHGYILARPKVVEPPAGCRPDMAILAELGRRLTPAEYWPEDDETLLNDLLAPAGLTYGEFADKGWLKGEDRFYKYEAKGFRTPTGKVELALSKADKLGVPPLPPADLEPVEPDTEFPLLLTSSKNPCYLHSSYRWIDSLHKKSPKPEAWIHPDTAMATGIRNGEPVAIETRHGRITQTARLTTAIAPDVVMAAYGWWSPPEPGDRVSDWKKNNYNMLTSTTALGREFGTPNLKAIPCRIRPQQR